MARITHRHTHRSDKPKPEAQTKDTSPLRKGVLIITVRKKKAMPLTQEAGNQCLVQYLINKLNS